MNCIFCNESVFNRDKICENDLAIAFLDINPVSKGHALIITKRHTETFFDTTKEEQIAMLELLNKCKKFIDDKYSPTGYNVGINCGKDAGQSIMHVHIHLIPRYCGDVENPRGGVRGIIPNRKDY